ncbi:hypothetical protein RJT34_19856 [Clitoria ternatea]|uniref:KaiA N-terminal domain-containing protein n=1 Tax=Clitoria ternatea TaxID=43366 RepID=A0AAN9IRV2_CLITE
MLQQMSLSSKLTEKLEQQLSDTLDVSTSALPMWCNQLMFSYPFVFSSEAKYKYFKFAAFGQPQKQPHQFRNNSITRRKFVASRSRILEAAAQMMEQEDRNAVACEVNMKMKLA